MLAWRRAVRIVVIWTAALLTVLSVAGTAGAHASLLSSSPVANGVLDQSPAQIVLNFDESVDTVSGSIRLVDATGNDVEVGKATRDQGHASIVASVPELASGTYVVAWRALSGDSHPISGAFLFSVKTQTATAPGLVERLLDDEHADRADEVALSVGRSLSYAGLALLVGVFVVLAATDRAALASRRARHVMWLGAAVGVVGTAIMIGFQGAVSGSSVLSPSAWRDVADTRAGGWWAIRLVILALGVLLPAVARRYRADGPQPAVIVGYVVALMTVTAAGGHGTSGKWVPLGFASTVIHLGAMAVWVGGAVALAFVVQANRRLSMAAVFSRYALFSVAALVITGSINAWRQSASLSQLVHSSYGTWLIAKLVVVAAVLAIASISRRTVHGGDDEPATSTTAASRLGRLIVIEVLGMALIVGATAGLVSSAPPRQAAAAPLSVSVVDGERIAQLVLDPPVSGGTTMHIYVTSTTGSLDPAISMIVTADLPAQDITGLVIPMQTAGPGHLTSNDADLPVAGTWTITITAKYGEFDQAVFRLEAAVR